MALTNFEDKRLPHGPLVLECKDGHELRVSPDIICMISPVLSDMIAAMGESRLNKAASSKDCARLKVYDTTVEQWRVVLQQVYPTVTRPRMTNEEIVEVLPLVHKYNIEVVMSLITGRLADELPGKFSLDTKSDAYVLGWLCLADRLQLDKLKDVCLQALKEPLEPDFGTQAGSGCLDEALEEMSQGTWIDVLKAVTGPCQECTKQCTCNVTYATSSYVKACIKCNKGRRVCRRCDGLIKSR